MNAQHVGGKDIAEFVDGILEIIVRAIERRRVPIKVVAQREQVLDERGRLVLAIVLDVHEGAMLRDGLGRAFEDAQLHPFHIDLQQGWSGTTGSDQRINAMRPDCLDDGDRAVIVFADAGRADLIHRAVALIDHELHVAIAIGEKGMIYATEDGGKSWKQWPGFPVIFTYMRGIAFAPGDRIGYIVGQRAMVLRSEDAGKTWTKVLPKDPVQVAEAD